MLADDVLVEIFDFYVGEDVDDIDEDLGPFKESGIEKWKTLVHVSRRWRSVVFQSPHRLNLRLLCTPKTRVRDILDIWPPLPLIIRDVDDMFNDGPSNVDNIIAALEHNDRVCRIQFRFLTSSQLEYITDLAAMRKSLLELTDLWFIIDDGQPGPTLPDSFLGGTAPRLRSLILDNVPFPGLPKLLLSTIHLVHLSLYRIPHSGYIPPKAMATALSALTNLEYLCLGFRYPRPRPALNSQRLPPPPLTRSILPSLTKILFKGASEYLEEILARIDTPRLNELDITFFNQIIFNPPQLFQFISRTPTLRALPMGHIAFKSDAIFVGFPSQTSDYYVLSVTIPCAASEWQLTSLEQVCTSSLPSASTLEDLYILKAPNHRLCSQDDVEITLWLDLLRPFIAVKNLYLSVEFVPRIAPALQELVGGRTTEVLPTLGNIFLEVSWFSSLGPLRVHKGIEKFVAARQLTNRPVTVSRWDRRSK
jgi:hypothetical protein